MTCRVDWQRMEPRLGGPVAGAAIPPVDYLDWYIPRLGEKRPHDLSQSGYGHPWDLDVDTFDQLSLWSKGLDPAEWVAARYDVAPDQVCMAHGVCQALTFAILAALPAEGPRVVGVEMPSFAVVSQCARLLGCEVIPFERDLATNGYDRAAVRAVIESCSVMVLTPVLNPTGHLLDEADEDWLVETTRDLGVSIVSDEVYLDAAMGTADYRPMHAKGEHVLSVNSLTKCYGLGAIRVGWVIGSTARIRAARDAFYNLQGLTSGPSMAIAQQAFPRLDEALVQMRANRAANLPLLSALLEETGFDFDPPPFGIFGSIDLGTNACTAIDTHGAELGLLATPGGMFHADLANHMRIAWGNPPDAFAAAMPVLRAFLERIQESRA